MAGIMSLYPIACTLKEEVVHILYMVIHSQTFVSASTSHAILMCPQGGIIQQKPCVTDSSASVLWKDDLAAH